MKASRISKAMARGPKYFVKKSLIKIMKRPAVRRKTSFANKCVAGKVKLSSNEKSKCLVSAVGKPFLSEAAVERVLPMSLEYAKKYMNGEFCLFGEFVPFRTATEEGFPWNSDFVHGVNYPMSLYTSFKRAGNEDVKIPWELGRMQSLLHLAIACVGTGESSYYEELMATLRDFEASCPVGYGPQWVCTMEVGIRVFNVVQAYAIAVRSNKNEMDCAFVSELAFKHGSYIFANLETDARLFENNHYVANLLGLAAISSIFPDLPDSTMWGDYASSEAERVCRTQILNDGSGFEGSVRYSRLVWEMLCLTALCLESCGRRMSSEFWRRIELQAEYLNWMTTCSGNSFQVGDNDSGRVVAGSLSSYADLRYPLQSLQKGDVEDSVDAIIYSGVPETPMSLVAGSYKLFPEGRFFVYRDEDLYFLMCATDSHRFDVPGHSHGDKLSLCLEYKGQLFLVDPGTGNYTFDEKQRNELRSTGSHSTLLINDAEQNPFEGAFSSLPTGGTVLSCEDSDDGFRVCGSHSCYVSRFGVKHERFVEYDAICQKLVVHDSLVGKQHDIGVVQLRWALAPDVAVEIDGESALLNGRGSRIKITCQGANFDLAPSSYSCEYGHVAASRLLICPIKTNECTTIIELLG